MILRWILILLPAFMGLLIGSFLSISNAYNPIVYVRAELGAVVFLLGMLLSVIVGATALTTQRFKDSRSELMNNATRDRRRFIQRLDHELKNPLTAIIAGLANLSASDQFDQAALDSVKAQVNRLSRLVADLRKLSDLEARPLEHSRIDLSSLLEEIFEFSRSRPDAKTREIHLQIPQAPWPLPQIMGDRDLLYLAIHNLLDNAIKFSQEGARIELRAREEGNFVLIEVADTGPGIPIDEIGYVWSELFRGKGARGVPGSGLGLALVEAIISRHNGVSAVRSRPEQGTVISIQLPVIEQGRK